MEEEKEVQVEVPAEEIQAEEPAKEEAKTEEVVADEVVEKPKPKKTRDERIDELTRKWREEERHAEYWKAKALGKEEAPTPVVPVIPSGRPTLDQFETTQEYEDKLFEWYEQKKELSSAGRKRELELQSAYRTYEDRADKARAEFEDFDDVIKDTPYTETMKVALWKNEHGPELAYYIATHPKDGKRIINLTPDEQLIELGRLETKLLLAKQTKKVSEAPKPITPVGMGGGGKSKDPSEMSTAEWMEWDKQQQKEKLSKSKPWLFPK